MKGYMKNFLFVIFVVTALSFGKVMLLFDHIMPGDEITIFANINNRNNKDADDIKVIAYFPELSSDFITTTNVFDLNGNSDTTKRINMNSVGIPKGEFLLRISASNDDFSIRKFRYIVID